MNQNGYEIFYSVLFYTISALISIGINVVFYFRARKSKLLSAFLNVQFIVVVWLLAKVLKKAAPNDEIAWLWVVVQYMAVCFFGTVFLNFTYLYQKGIELPSWIKKVLYGFSFINYMVVFTNQFHHMFFKSVTIFESSYGPWFYVHTIFSYLLILIAYFFLINALVKNHFEVPLMQALLFNVGLLMPVAANLGYIFGVFNFTFDITPIMFNVTIIIFGYSAYRYRFLDIKRVTRTMVLENIHEGIIIVDNAFRIIEKNSIISDMINESEKTDKFMDLFQKGYSRVDKYEELKVTITNGLNNKEDKVTMDFVMDVHGIDKNYILKMEKIKDHLGDQIGFVFRFIDITKHKELLRSLEESNEALIAVNQQLSENISATKQLAIAKERSHVSKEMHDILGHSVTIVISLLELSKAAIYEDYNLASEKVTQGMEIIRGGILELKKSMKKNSNDFIAANKLSEDLVNLISGFEKSGVNVDFYYKKSDVKLSTDTYDTAYRVCQEGLTNALRHGKAKNVTIGVRFVERNIDLFIIDDGNGCGEVKKGNGLSGMETRVNELSGYFSCGSPDGQGFNIHATLPFYS